MQLTGSELDEGLSLNPILKLLDEVVPTIEGFAVQGSPVKVRQRRCSCCLVRSALSPAVFAILRDDARGAEQATAIGHAHPPPRESHSTVQCTACLLAQLVARRHLAARSF